MVALIRGRGENSTGAGGPGGRTRTYEGGAYSGCMRDGGAQVATENVLRDAVNDLQRSATLIVGVPVDRCLIDRTCQ